MRDAEAIRQRACEVRNYLRGGRAGEFVAVFKRFPAGCCKAAGTLLLQWLRDQEDSRDAQLIANAQRPDPEDSDSEATHSWIELDDMIIDLTCDQFADGPDAPFVSRDRSWHETFSGERAYPMSEFVPLGGDHLPEYKRMAAELAGHGHGMTGRPSAP